MDIYQLQQSYLEKGITYIPYHEGYSTNADHAGFFYYPLTHKKIFELISNLCDFYGNWLEGLYSKKASYIKRDLIDLKKSLRKNSLNY